MIHTTPEHYEVSITTEDSTPTSVIACKYLVIADSADAAEAHVQRMHPTGLILPKTLHRTECQRRFEIAASPEQRIINRRTGRPGAVL